MFFFWKLESFSKLLTKKNGENRDIRCSFLECIFPPVQLLHFSSKLGQIKKITQLRMDVEMFMKPKKKKPSISCLTSYHLCLIEIRHFPHFLPHECEYVHPPLYHRGSLCHGGDPQQFINQLKIHFFSFI